MDRALKICYAFIDFDSSNKDFISSSSLRGFFGNNFIDDVEFHHHIENSFFYNYPLIQYKRIGDRLVVLGIEKYSQIIFNKISQIDYITNGYGKRIKINNIELKTRKFCIVQMDITTTTYKFQSPWLALNSENFKKFISSSLPKKSFLENILIGNILSMLKGLKIFIDFKLSIIIKDIIPAPILLNNNSFLAFKATFSANILLPEYIGLGKSVSKGFGTLFDSTTKTK
ncbi:MAG: CRISPR-associated endonuclease Cas6 [Candidatus Nitrosocosmicus sp.]